MFKYNATMNSETVTISKKKYEQLKQDASAFRDSRLYKRLLEFEKNISTGKKYYRKDLGF